MTTRAEIKGWLERGIAEGATHVMIAWDDFDGPDGDYPIYVGSHENVYERVAKFSSPSNADRLIEVYNLSLPLDPQLNERRAWNL